MNVLQKWQGLQHRLHRSEDAWSGSNYKSLSTAVIGKLESSRSRTRVTFHSTEMTIEDPAEVSIRSRELTGFWPISFSWPHRVYVGSNSRPVLLAQIRPGQPYAYHDATEYYSAYRQSVYALTHKKAGWDCFRHVEILGNGALPLMPDISGIPEYTMASYPKAFMRFAYEQATSKGAVPDTESLRALAQHVEDHLTSRAAMARVLATEGKKPHTVLFVDEQLSRQADYLSLFALMGLLELLGRDCTVAFPVPYMLSSWSGDASKLYGRGFGYVRSLNGYSASYDSSGTAAGSSVLSELDAYDAIVVGSVMRNERLARLISKASIPGAKYFLHGEDAEPHGLVRRWLKKLRGEVFVRELSL